MIFPLNLCTDLGPEHEERWRAFYTRASDRDRRREDGIWRRTQCRANSDESAWQTDSDQRRRIVHYSHEYQFSHDHDGRCLRLGRTYIYYSLSLPREELRIEFERIRSALESADWVVESQIGGVQRWNYQDLTCTISEFDQHPEDLLAGRTLPGEYQSLDVTITAGAHDTVERQLPWNVLSKGMRMKDQRGEPTVVADLAVLRDFTPFQVELGCGASIEAGIPPLHHLHELYRVTDMNTGRFIFGGRQDDLVERLLLAPTVEFAKLGELFTASFTAEPTAAHRALVALRDSGHLVGRIMTNNFDGLAHRVGLAEHFLRRYDEQVPDVEFHPEAKALLVIGSHADRRRVQARARRRGMQIVFLDPEGYWAGDRFIDYPLEGPRAGDLLCRQGASAGLSQLCAHLGLIP